MQRIDALLKKRREIIPTEVVVREILVPFFNKEFRITIRPNQIKLVKTTLVIDAEPVLKHTIKLRKEIVFSQLKKQNIRITAII